MKFEINFIFLIKPSQYMTKKKRGFELKKKTFFIIFKGLSVARKLSQTLEA